MIIHNCVYRLWGRDLLFLHDRLGTQVWLAHCPLCSPNRICDHRGCRSYWFESPNTEGTFSSQRQRWAVVFEAVCHWMLGQPWALLWGSECPGKAGCKLWHRKWLRLYQKSSWVCVQLQHCLQLGLNSWCRLSFWTESKMIRTPQSRTSRHSY